METKGSLSFYASIVLALYLGHSVRGFLGFLRQFLPKISEEGSPRDPIKAIEESLEPLLFALEKLQSDGAMEDPSKKGDHDSLPFGEGAMNEGPIMPLLRELISSFHHLLHAKHVEGTSHFSLAQRMAPLLAFKTGRTEGFEEDELFANHLLQNHLLDNDALTKAKEIQRTINPHFGQIGMNHGFILQEHVDKVLKVQNRIKKKFGELAIQMGILTKDQVEIVLQFQRERHVPLYKIIGMENIVAEEKIVAIWEGFRASFNRGPAHEKDSVPDLETAMRESFHSLHERLGSFERFRLRPGIVFENLFKVVLSNAQKLPAGLWGEIVESGLLSDVPRTTDLSTLLRNTRYFRKGVLAEESVEKKLKTIQLFDEIRKFLEKVLWEETFAQDIPEGAMAQKGPENAEETGSSIAVVLLDDDPSFCEMVSEMLDGTPYRLLCFGTASQMIGEFDKLQADILLLDYEMPGMNGLEVLKWLKPKKPNLPVIIVTSNASVQLGVSALKLGACDCLDKPFSKNTLLEKLAEVYKTSQAKTGWSCSGILSSTPLIEVLQICCTTQHSGVLSIDSDQRAMKIYFKNGRIVEAKHSHFNGFKALLRIALVEEGTFEFTAMEKVECAGTINADPMILLMELARQCDEFRRLKKILPDMRCKLSISNEQEAQDPITNLLKAQSMSIQEVIDICGMGEIEVLQRIHDYLGKGILKAQQI